MPEISDRKLYLGPRLRVLRRELGINQTRMAEELGVSPSYLNHLERNQRPLTAQMLVRLANTYDIDMRDFVSGAGQAVAGDLTEAFADGLVRDIGVPRQELMDVAENYPGVAEAIGRIYRALTDLRRVPAAIEQLGTGGGGARSPLDWLSGWFEQRRGHVAELDGAAEALAADLPEDPADLALAIRRRLSDAGITVMLVPEKVLPAAWRHYDYHRRRLMLAERLPAPARLFALATQWALTALAEPIEALVARADTPDAETRTLLTIALANYAAAAIAMPYDRIRRAAEECGHDLPLLQARFGVSFEQLAHRLTTLGRPGSRGLPFFLIKVDRAGQVAKRFLGEAAPFARTGGPCPRWGLDRAPAAGRIGVRLVEMPDERRFLTLFQAVEQPGQEGGSTVAIGCEAKHAAAIVHAAPALRDPPVTIGPGCLLCERPHCPDRALPPITRSLELNPWARPTTPYPFRRN